MVLRATIRVSQRSGLVRLRAASLENNRVATVSYGISPGIPLKARLAKDERTGQETGDAMSVRDASDDEDETRTAQRGQPRRRDYRPSGVERDPGRLGTAKRLFTEFSEDNMSDWAAALTYYGLLALFPALIAVVALIGLVGDPVTTTQKVTEIVTNIGPSSAAETFAGPIKSITSHRGTAGILLVLGLLGSLYSASSYVGAFMRASNVVFETPEGRPFWKLRPLQMLVTLIMLLLLVAVALALVLTGPVVNAVAGPLGVGGTAVSIWEIAKWPVLILVVVVMFTVLFYASPNVRLRGLRWVAPGAAFSLVVWLIASVAFAFYAANFGSYDKTYGSLGGIVAFLVWLWITNAALLLGMELNSERERSQEIREGVPAAHRELQMDARDDPKTQKTT
jgi:membrane protein